MTNSSSCSSAKTNSMPRSSGSDPVSLSHVYLRSPVSAIAAVTEPSVSQSADWTVTTVCSYSSWISAEVSGAGCSGGSHSRTEESTGSESEVSAAELSDSASSADGSSVSPLQPASPAVPTATAARYRRRERGGILLATDK